MARLTLFEELAQIHREALAAGLERTAELIIERARIYMPAHDPVRDPDPTANLAEMIHFRWLPDGSIEVYVEGPYAAKQHEAMWFKHPRGGGPKYLERAVTEIAEEMPGLIKAEVEARTKAWKARTKGVY
jgi:hypothetical protein